MPIVRRTDCIKPHVSLDVLAAVVWSRDTSSTLPQSAYPGWHHTRFYTVISPDDGHDDASKHVEIRLIVNKHLYLCHLLVLSSPTLMMHGHMNLKLLGLSLSSDKLTALHY